jgi:hypothetical protein
MIQESNKKQKQVDLCTVCLGMDRVVAWRGRDFGARRVTCPGEWRDIRLQVCFLMTRRHRIPLGIDMTDGLSPRRTEPATNARMPFIRRQKKDDKCDKRVVKPAIETKKSEQLNAKAPTTLSTGRGGHPRN